MIPLTIKPRCEACDGTGRASPVMDEEELGQPLGSAAYSCPHCLPPTFGQVIRNPHASVSNPQRDGYYVETVVRRGRVNKGAWWRLTDGAGVFWEIPAVKA
jgi:hypothetical protein